MQPGNNKYYCKCSRMQLPLTVNFSDKTEVWRTEPNIHDSTVHTDSAGADICSIVVIWSICCLGYVIGD